MIPAVMPVYKRADLAFERGEGAYLFAADGRRYLDFMSGVAVTALGHCHPRLVAALTAQAHKLWHTSNIFQIPSQQRLAERFVARTFADTVFFCNSGAEAVEAAIKIARKYHDETGHPERYRVVCCEGAFHGRTLATISAGGQERYRAGFLPAVDGFDHVAFGNLNEMRAKIGPETAAILVEPVQGEGGIRTADPVYFQGLRKIADEYGILLMFDEVQTGMGRTGKLFAYEWTGIAPDVLATAKGIGNGFPIGACLANERAGAAMKAGSHASTFGGNPLAMAVANAVLDILLEDGFLDRVNRIAEILHRRTAELAARHPTFFVEARGQGLLLGLRTKIAHTDMVAALRENGLLAVPAGDDVVRFAPPLIIDETHIDEAMAIVDRTCRQWNGGKSTGH